MLWTSVSKEVEKLRANAVVVVVIIATVNDVYRMNIGLKIGKIQSIVNVVKNISKSNLAKQSNVFRGKEFINKLLKDLKFLSW